MKHFNLKISFSLLIIITTLGSFSQGTWEIADVPTKQWLRSVFFVDSLYGWVAGHSGTMLNTTDGGDSWTVQDSQTENDIVDVFFLNRNLGWASSFNFSTSPYGTVILKTINGGEDWIQENYPEENIFMNCILFLDSLNGWMGGSPHALVCTNDGGMTWQQAQIDTATLAFFPVLSIQFYNENYGYASGGMHDIAGVIWRTWDGGEHWYVIDVSDAPADEVHALHLFDSLNVLGAGGDPDFGYGVGLIRTDDGGLNWDYEELEIQGNAFDLDFVTEAEVWAPLGPRRKFIYSIDGGVNWTSTHTPDSTVILDVCFADSLHGFAVGPDGAMLKYIPPVPVSVNELIPWGNDNHTLLQNFPNPFNTITNIRFLVLTPFNNSTPPDILPSYHHVQIKVYDVLGNEVAILVDEVLSSGEYNMPFYGSNLSAGIYFYQITIDYTTGAVVESHRMVKVQ